MGGIVVVSRFVLVEAPLSRGSKLEITWREKLTGNVPGTNDPTSTTEAHLQFEDMLTSCCSFPFLFLVSLVFLYIQITASHSHNESPFSKMSTGGGEALSLHHSLLKTVFCLCFAPSKYFNGNEWLLRHSVTS